VVAQGTFDIFFSHTWIHKCVLSYVYEALTRSGYRVWYDMDEMGYDLQKSMRDGIANSTVVVVCLNRLYMSRENCMFELKEAYKTGKRIIVFAIEPNVFDWINGNAECKAMCDVSAHMLCDAGVVAVKAGWEAEAGPTAELKATLVTKVSDMIKIVQNAGCNPSMPPSGISEEDMARRREQISRERQQIAEADQKVGKYVCFLININTHTYIYVCIYM
jgi:hypothetical protein